MINPEDLNKEDKEAKFLEDYFNSKAGNKKADVEKNEKLEKIAKHVNLNDYSPISIEELPTGGRFYQPDMEILIRSAKTVEIEQYSTMQQDNFISVSEELTNLLASCTRVRYSGRVGSYKDIRDADKLYIIFMIRDLTFQNRNKLEIPFYDKDSNSEGMVEVCRENFDLYEMDEELEDFYSEDERCFVFPTQTVEYKLAPPSIGIQLSFFEQLKEKGKNKQKMDLATFKIIPFLLRDKNNVDIETIDKLAEKLKNFTLDEFSFLNAVCEKMIFGIKGLKHYTEAGVEVQSPLTFPNGFPSIFLISNPIANFIKK